VVTSFIQAAGEPKKLRRLPKEETKPTNHREPKKLRRLPEEETKPTNHGEPKKLRKPPEEETKPTNHGESKKLAEAPLQKPKQVFLRIYGGCVKRMPSPLTTEKSRDPGFSPYNP
jgi:hypothetical protein